MKIYIPAIFAIASICLFSCDAIQKTGSSTSTTDVLRSKNWTLVQMNNMPLPKTPAKPITLNFTSLNAATGNGGCNTYGGQYLVTGNSELKFSSVYSTKMACEDLDLESTYFGLLEKANKFNLDNNKLLIFNGSQEILEFAGIAK